jgi:ribosome biogenesis GTPase
VQEGIIIKRIGGFCYVLASNQVYTCKPRGRLRQGAKDILPGDRVLFQRELGVVEEILPRRVQLIRPPIANVDQVVIVFAGREPTIDFMLLDRLLVTVAAQDLGLVICFNKSDLARDPRSNLYREIGYPTIYTSTVTGEGIDELQAHLEGKISCLAGPSGVGKSSLLNAIIPGAQLQTAKISQKMKRGRHTTRSVELLRLPNGGLVADTPGFSQLSLHHLERERLAHYFPEMGPLIPHCRFSGCLHDQEPDCAVRAAVEREELSPDRYDHYLAFLEEIREYELRRY